MGTDGYAIGSIADLISGKTTPSKPKVVQKVFEKQFPKTSGDAQEFPKKAKVKKTQGKPENQINFSSKKKLQNTTPQGKRKFSQDEKRENFTPRGKRKSSENVENQETKGKFTPRTKRKLSNDVQAEETEPPKKKAKEISESEKLTANRTLFVGNVPITMKKKKLTKFFSKYGDVESLRIRGVPVADVRVSKKVAYMTKKYHPKRTSVLCFVKYRTPEDAQKALVLNGQLLEDHHLRVRLCSEEQNPDSSRALFIGNVSFTAEDEEVWKLFEPCGQIESVRIVRDGKTGVGRGFGYVNFESADSVELAMQMGTFSLNGRDLRVSVYKTNAKKKERTNNLQRRVKNNKPVKKEKKGGAAAEDKKTVNAEEQEKKIKKPKQSGFEGVKISEKKKKKKLNKGLLQKKQLVKKLAPKVTA